MYNNIFIFCNKNFFSLVLQRFHYYRLEKKNYADTQLLKFPIYFMNAIKFCVYGIQVFLVKTKIKFLCLLYPFIKLIIASKFSTYSQTYGI